MSSMLTTTTEDLALPAPSDPSTPLDLTPSTTPAPTSLSTAIPNPPSSPNTPPRDPVIQRNAVFGERYLTDPTKVYDYNSWDQVVPDPDHLLDALEKIQLQKEGRVPEKERKRFLDRPAYFWDLFYRNNRENFFKNRKWLVREFQCLGECLKEDAGERVIFEAGCGVGNAIFPLLAENKNPHLTIHGRDYSPRAVEVLKSDPQYNPEFVTAGVWDITSEESPDGIPSSSCDVIILCFVLSALEPGQWKQAISNLYNLLKPGGIICFRDYGRYDMTQLRFKKDRLLDDNFYIRGDGTRVYFFEEAALLRRRMTVDELEEMFSEFVVEQLVVDRRLLVNRQNLKKMYRVWYQGRFRKRREGEELKDAKNAEGVGERGVGEERVRDVDETIEG